MTLSSPGRSEISHDSPMFFPGGSGLLYRSARRRPPQMRSLNRGMNVNGYSKRLTIVQKAHVPDGVLCGIPPRGITDLDRDVLRRAGQVDLSPSLADHRNPGAIVD